LQYLWSVTSGLMESTATYSAPWAKWLLSQWMLHWWRVNVSTACEAFLCIQPLPNTRRDRSQVPFFKS